VGVWGGGGAAWAVGGGGVLNITILYTKSIHIYIGGEVNSNFKALTLKSNNDRKF
jgi:hypothetical protein